MILPISKVSSSIIGIVAAKTSTSFVKHLAYSPPIIPSIMTKLMPTSNVFEMTVHNYEPTVASIPLLLRGGAAATSAVLDLSRESYMIAELATYGTLTALVMNCALRLWTSTKFSKEQSPIISNGFTISTVLCVIAGAFTAILFQLLGIYSKSALQMTNDEGYKAFKTATAIYRKWGFRCFLTELSTFVFSFIFSLYNRLWTEAKVHNPEEKSRFQRVGTYIMAGSIILMCIGAFHIKHVLDLATKYIFIDAYHDAFA